MSGNRWHNQLLQAHVFSTWLDNPLCHGPLWTARSNLESVPMPLVVMLFFTDSSIACVGGHDALRAERSRHAEQDGRGMLA